MSIETIEEWAAAWQAFARGAAHDIPPCLVAADGRDLADADYEAPSPACLRGLLQAAGQTQTTASRILGAAPSAFTRYVTPQRHSKGRPRTIAALAMPRFFFLRNRMLESMREALDAPDPALGPGCMREALDAPGPAPGPGCMRGLDAVATALEAQVTVLRAEVDRLRGA